MNGTIPAAIGSLTKLQLLQFENNNLNGSLPTSFRSLASLQYLNLNGNQLTGNIVLQNSLNYYVMLAHLGSISPIGFLTKLTSIILSSNYFTGLCSC